MLPGSFQMFDLFIDKIGKLLSYKDPLGILYMSVLFLYEVIISNSICMCEHKLKPSIELCLVAIHK